MKLELKLLDNASEQLLRMARGSASMAQTVRQVGTRLPYGYGEEFGSHRKNGKLARKGGGALFLTRARADVLADGSRDLAEGLTKVAAPGAWVVVRLARWVRRLARTYAPVGEGPVDKHPGKLRKAIIVARQDGSRA